MEDTFPLCVRLDGRNIQLRVNLDWSVFQLKQQLYLHTNSSAQDLKVVFAGSELKNSVLLKNCQFAHGTVVHAVVTSTGDNAVRGINHVSPTNFIAPTADGIKTQTKTRRARFYVYCKSFCNDVKPGKLRVKCQRCKDEAFEISRGPSCWTDVLTNNRIGGRCNSTGCKGTVAEFYFKCSETCANDEHTTSCCLPLPLLRTNVQDVPCLACTDVRDVVLVFQCEESHVICLECFAAYCKSNLDYRQFVLMDNIGYTLPCPGRGDSCQRCYIEEIHHFLIAGKEQYERYKNFATEEFVLQNGGIFCPGEGCGNGLMLEDTSRKVICHRSRGGCGFIFCRECRLVYHDDDCEVPSNQANGERPNNVYEVSRSNALHARWRDELNSRETIGKTTKTCPGCKTPTEKSGGCNHMTCLRCQHEWCWLCQVQWTRNCEADHWFRAG